MASCVVLSCDASEPTLPNEFLLGPPIRLEIQPASVDLIEGNQSVLAAHAFDANNRRVPIYVQWTSSNPFVATIGEYDGVVTGIAVGEAMIKATDGALLSAAVLVKVRPPLPPAQLLISPTELILQVPAAATLTVTALDAAGIPTPASVQWASQDPGVATVNRSTGVVTAIGLGSTQVTASVGSVNASIPVRVEPPEFLMQWATGATASSQYGPDEWSALQATGVADVADCSEESRSWASLDTKVDWLELTYDEPVRPSDIRIHEVWSPGSIVKVEVKDLSDTYHTVYEATPSLRGGCLYTLDIRVTSVAELVNKVRVTVDQRVRGDWNEIDAVRLNGYRKTPF
jgi:hypothetical protein